MVYIHLYRLYYNNESKFKYIWSSIKPNGCLYDSAHNIRDFTVLKTINENKLKNTEIYL